MNRKLSEMYSRVLHDIWPDLAAVGDLRGPLLIDVPNAYLEATVKLMIVGQQTNGWGHPEDGIEGLFAQYRGFDLGKTSVRSPFWQAAHEVYESLNPAGPPRGFLWSNLIKVEVAQERPPRAIEELISSTNLLQNELSITQPNVVVFFTGPCYDERLRATFAGVEYERVNDSIDRLIHDELPEQTFRSYHPNYLRRSGKWSVIEELKTLVSVKPPPPTPPTP
ncbi:MAG: hypothetical protein OXB98_20630 [Bryobacterales bacterium]|nr:hypothetical protein [Bryobacterales bacterium]